MPAVGKKGFCENCIIPDILERMVQEDGQGCLADRRVREAIARLVELVADNGSCEVQAPDYMGNFGEDSHVFSCEHELAMPVISHIGDAFDEVLGDATLTTASYREEQVPSNLKVLMG